MASGFAKLEPASGKVTGTNSNMPLLVTPSAITNVGTITLAEAQSVRFYSDEAKTTELAREVVSADEIHVKVSSVTSTTDVFMDWDGVRSDYAVTDTYGRNAVWSAYGGVWHLNGNSNDSTANANNGTDTSVTYVSGKIGQAASGNGTTTEIDFGGGASIQTITDMSVSAIIKMDSIADSYYFSQSKNSSPFGRWILFANSLSKLGVSFLRSNGSQYIASSTTSYTTGTPYIVHATISGTAIRIYVNGVHEGSATFSGIRSSTTGNITLFQRDVDGVVDTPGDIDEPRYIKVALSADWIATEYQNQNDNGAFWVATNLSGGGVTPNAIAFAGGL